MIDTALIDAFYDYLVCDNSKKDWADMDLIEDAPITARIAFDQYKDIMKDAKERGIEV